MAIIFLIGFIFLVAGLVTIARGSYRSLIKFRRLYTQAFARADLQCRHRYDLIFNLMEAIEKYMAHEHEILEAMSQDRHVAISAYLQASQDLGNPALVQSWETAEAALAQSLRRLLALIDVEPHLKSDQRIGRLVADLAAIENRIVLAREYANEVAMLYNFKRDVFPSGIIAKLCHFETAPLLENSISEELEPVTDDSEFREPKINHITSRLA